MKNTVHKKPRGNPTWKPAYKGPSTLMTARIPLTLAEAIANYRRELPGHSRTDVIIQALEAFFAAKK